MQNLDKSDLLSCANAILDKTEVSEEETALCDKLLRIAAEMPEADEVTERLLKELQGMLHPV